MGDHTETERGIAEHRRTPSATLRPEGPLAATDGNEETILALQILNAGPGSDEIVRQLREAIESALTDAEVEVRSGSPGHFEIRVRSEAFAGKPTVRQHQLVYAAITHLMSGDAPPVHAIDRLECESP